MKRPLLLLLALAGCSSGARLHAPAPSACAPCMSPGLPGIRLPSEAPNREGYAAIEENGFVRTRDEPLSTFAVDVDTASYANVRRMLREGTLPPKGAVRVEEMVNYFPYEDPAPPADASVPFAVRVDAAGCPWDPSHRLVRVALRGRDVAREGRPPMNLVFLVDVSGSMADADKLPLVKTSLRMLLDELDGRDRVAMVV
jgi:Ca-activated chloride channel family protein